MDIGGRLRDIRKAKKLSIYKLSQATGISENHISGIENGKRQPTIDTLKRLIAPLGITLSELFNEGSDVSYLSENERKLIENYRELSTDKASVLLTVSDMLK